MPSNLERLDKTLKNPILTMPEPKRLQLDQEILSKWHKRGGPQELMQTWNLTRSQIDTYAKRVLKPALARIENSITHELVLNTVEVGFEIIETAQMLAKEKRDFAALEPALDAMDRLTKLYELMAGLSDDGKKQNSAAPPPGQQVNFIKLPETRPSVIVEEKKAIAEPEKEILDAEPID